MRTLLIASLTVLVTVFALSCAEEGTDVSPAPLAIFIQGLDSNCSASGDAAAVGMFRVKIVDKSDGLTTVADEEFSAEGSTLSLEDVPESAHLELTVLGLGGGRDEPVYYGRYKNLSVTKNETSKVDMTLMRYADFSCPKKRPNGAPNVMFPSIVNLPDGRILIIGGFAKAVEESGRWQITTATDRAYVFDPKTGELRQTKNNMNAGRGAAGAVYLPKSKLVLVAGGAETMYMEKGGACFPFYFLKDKAGDVGFTYELFNVDTETFISWKDGWPDANHQMVKQARRVFPALSVNNDGSVLVTGGGQWPSCQTQMETDSDYRVAEFYRPKSENYDGGFVDSFNALTMKAMRSGHTSVLLETKDKLNYHLFWGGSTDGAEAEIYKESSGQLDGNYGAFSEVVWLDKTAYKSKRPFFHTMTPLRDRTFLLVGGANYKSGMKVPSASDAFLIKATSEQKIGVSALDGLGVGRYFHAAATYDADHVVVVGGFSSAMKGEDQVFAESATADIRFFDLAANKLSEPTDAKGLARGGLVAAPVNNDCLLLAGGADSPGAGLEFGGKSLPLVVEAYCPSMVCPEGLWATACYPEE